MSGKIYLPCGVCGIIVKRGGKPQLCDHKSKIFRVPTIRLICRVSK